MSSPSLSLLFRVARSVRPEAAQLPDVELVRRFAQGRDPAAFELLVFRHGPMVWGVCRRLLSHTQDAEDAFQATFLALARGTATIGERGAVAAWLYRVALYTSLAARKARRRRAVREWLTPEPPERTSGDCPAQAASARDLRRLIDEEVNGLPEKLRLPFLLCEIEGRARASVAAELGCPVGTVESRLSRARQRLRARLVRRGLAFPAVLAVAVPGSLHAATLRLAGESSVVSRPVRALAEQAARAASPGRPLTAALAACLFAVCAGLAVLAGPATEPVPRQEKKPPAAPAKGEQAVTRDEEGPPLPRGAIARIGSPRLRHAAPVSAVAYSPDGRWIASADVEGTVCIWDAANGRLRHRIPSGRSSEFAVGFSADSKRFLTCGPAKGEGTTGWLRTFDLETGKEYPALTAEGGRSARHSFALSPDGKLFGYFDDSFPGKYSLRDTATEKLIEAIPMPQGGFSVLPAFAAGGKTFAFAERGGPVTVRDLATGKQTEIADGQRQHRALALAPDGTALAVVSCDAKGTDEALALWDVKSGKLLRRITGLEVTSSCVAFSPDGKRLAVGNLQRLWVQLFDAATGKELRRFRSWPSVRQVVFSPDGKSLAAGRTLATVSVWDVETGKPRPASADPAGILFDLRSTDRGVFVGGCDVAVHDWKTGKLLHRYADPRTKSFEGFALSPDGRLMVLSEFEGPIRLINADTGKIVRTLAGHTTLAAPLLFAPDGRRLFSRGYDGTLRIWDVRQGKQLRKIVAGSSFSGDRLAVSPDGNLVASATSEGGGHVVQLWESTSGRELHRCSGGPQVVSGLSFSPDSTLLAAAGTDPASPLTKSSPPGAVVLWDTATGRRRQEQRGHAQRICAVEFSPDGRMFATGGDDYAVRLWEVASGKERRVLHGHAGTVFSLAFSKDGKHLASSSPEAPVFVWDVYGLSTKGPAEVRRLWDDLAGTDVPKAFQAVRSLATLPAEAITLCRANLKPANNAGEKSARQLLADLDSPRFAVRRRATAELEKRADDLEPLLRKALQKAELVERKKRLEGILDRLSEPGPERLRRARALEVLELIATPEAVKFLEELAGGAPSARLTRDAAAARDRLRKR